VTPGELRQRAPSALTRRGMVKVPRITAYFWIIKVLTTAQGESTSDYLVHRFNPYLAVVAGLVVFMISLVLQLRARRYIAWVYWFAVVMVAVFGTMVADVLHIEFGIPYAVSSAFFAAALAVVFIVWYRVERTLSIHSIYTLRRELFYWATVLATFALGTAVGDMTATTLGLGYFASAILFTVVIVIPAVAYRWLGMNSIFAFWFAYVITRPLGASYADWMGVSHSRGGLDYGRGPVALGLTVVIVALVGYMAAGRRDVPQENVPVRVPGRASGRASGRARHRRPLA
jgi:uncharacterized membrane-anchored protein